MGLIGWFGGGLGVLVIQGLYLAWTKNKSTGFRDGQLAVQLEHLAREIAELKQQGYQNRMLWRRYVRTIHNLCENNVPADIRRILMDQMEKLMDDVIGLDDTKS